MKKKGSSGLSLRAVQTGAHGGAPLRWIDAGEIILWAGVPVPARRFSSVVIA
jgi:hypothetical protein